MKVEVYSDVVCPWCYIGERRLARALEAFGRKDDVEVVFRPYQLDPSAPGEPMPLKSYLTGRYGSSASGMLLRVSETAVGEGISIDWDAALAANTLTAHRVLWLAEQEDGQDVQRALLEKLFALHFEEGGDISDVETLVEAAASVGMDTARVRALLGGDEGLAEVTAEIESAREVGISAVPTFVFEGKWAVQGAQPVSTLLQVLEEVERRTSPVGAAGGADACEDGTCAT